MNLFKLVKESITVKQGAVLYGLPVTSTWMTHCPLHEDHTPSMKLNDTYYYCFGCGATGFGDYSLINKNDIAGFKRNQATLFE